MKAFKNYEFFPEMKAAAAEKYGADGYLLQFQEEGLSQIHPPTHTPEGPFEFTPEFWLEEAPPRVIEETWEKVGDKYCRGESTWTTVPNPGWHLTVQRDGESYALDHVDSKGVAHYYTDGRRRVLLGRLTDAGLDVWDPAELAARPFPAIVGRNFLEDKTLSDALAERGITAKETELGCWKGTLSRLEYARDGQPRVAYEIVQAGIDSYGSTSVVLAEPVVQDERDLDWLYRLIVGRKQRPDQADTEDEI